MAYLCNSPDEIRQMLDKIGISSVDALFEVIPPEARCKLNLPEGKSELAVRQTLTEMAEKNKSFRTILRGAGAYDHYIPSIVKYVAAKEEFVTAYTPYQAEMSQGILQSIFEYQTMIASLTGMDVSNASVYDGATAAAEAVAMCRGGSGASKKASIALISTTAHKDTIETVQTYCWAADAELVVVPEKDGKMDLEALKGILNGEGEAAGKSVSCLYVQSPNFYGLFEEVETIATMIHQAGGKLIMGCNPMALALTKTPGELGADIAVGEGQPLGIPLSYGGPYLGFMATTTANARKLPGRIVGQTKDHHGNTAYVLTLQAREQHIRREKASSNICSNQALCALTASVYLSVMGYQGLWDAATQCHSKAKYLANALSALGLTLLYEGEYFHEFVTRVEKGKSKEILKALENEGILGGLPIGDDAILWCVTEKVSRKELDQSIKIIGEVYA